LKTKLFDFSGKVVEVLRSQYSPPASMRFDFRAHLTPSSSINLLPLPPSTPSRSPAKTSPPEQQEPHTTVGMLADQAQSVQAQKTKARQQQQQQQEREEGGEYKVETEHAEWVAQDLKSTEMEGREKEATGERWERDASGREEMMEKQKEDTRKEKEKKEREMEDSQNEERRQKEHVSAIANWKPAEMRSQWSFGEIGCKGDSGISEDQHVKAAPAAFPLGVSSVTQSREADANDGLQKCHPAAPTHLAEQVPAFTKAQVEVLDIAETDKPASTSVMRPSSDSSCSSPSRSSL